MRVAGRHARGLASRLVRRCATTSAVEYDGGKRPQTEESWPAKSLPHGPDQEPALPYADWPVAHSRPEGPAPHGTARGWIGVVVIAVVVAGATGIGVGAGVAAVVHGHNTAVVKFSPNASVFRRMDNIKAVLARVLPSVVAIQALGPGCATEGGTQLEDGTGIILTRGGEVLTNDHVIANASEITVTLYGRAKPYPATLVGTDPTYDVALLQLRAPPVLRAVTLGDSSKSRVGEDVLAIGNALALSQSTPSVTEGIISAKGRSIKVGGGECAGTESLTGLLQTQAAINPGNSGGPLVDSAGQVIGMNTAAATDQSGDAPTQNIGFAIPIRSIESLLAGLEQGGSIGRPKAFLGVEVVSITPAERLEWGLSVASGALVLSVFPGAPAARAGIQPGDVIVSFAGHAIATDVALTAAEGGLRPGQTVDIDLYRGRRLLTISLVLGTRPAPQAGAS